MGQKNVKSKAEKAISSTCIDGDTSSSTPDVCITPTKAGVIRNPRYTAITSPPQSIKEEDRDSDKTLICTRIADYTECLLYGSTKAHLLNFPKFGRSPQTTRSSRKYEIRTSFAGEGRGMFAMQDIDVGGLILAERPLIVAPVVNDFKEPTEGVGFPEDDDAYELSVDFDWGDLENAAKFEAILEVAFNRMSQENQKAYLQLHSNKSEGYKLRGIFLTNSFECTALDLLDGDEGRYLYSAVLRNMSMINHSCRANCILSFDPASVSCEIRATRPIAKNEEILYAYISPLGVPDTDIRRRMLEQEYGFQCRCATCIDPDTELPYSDSNLTFIKDTFELLEEDSKNKRLARDVYGGCIDLMERIESEDLDGSEMYYNVLKLCHTACLNLSMDGGLSGKEQMEFKHDAYNWKDLVEKYSKAYNGFE